MSACLFCGSSQRDFSIKFCDNCGSNWVEDAELDDINQVAKYCASLYQTCESSQDDQNGKDVKQMRERFKISHRVHTQIFKELVSKLKIVETLKNFRLEFDENVNNAYAKQDTFLRFRFTNLSDSERFKSVSLFWDDPEAPDHLDFRAKSQSPIKAGENCDLTSTHIFERYGPKPIDAMKLSVENFFGDSAEFLVNTFYFTVGNPDQNVVNNITTHTQIRMDRGVVDNSNNEAAKKSETEKAVGGIGAPKWRELKTHIVLEPPEDLAELLSKHPLKNILPPPANLVQSEEAEFKEARAQEIVGVSKSGSLNKLEPQNVSEASEAVFKCFHQLNEITPYADPNAVVNAANFSLDFLDLVFASVTNDIEDIIQGMVFENGPSVITNAQDDVINFSGNALVFSVTGISAVTCLEDIFEGQAHYSWAEIKANDWTFYRRRFGENSYLISFGDRAAGQNFPGCKFDLRKYTGDQSLNDFFTSAENALAKVIELAPPLPLPEEVQAEEDEEEIEELVENEPEPEPVVDNSALIELDLRLQRFFSSFSFALQFCKEGHPKSVFTENEVASELLDNLYEVINESGTGLSVICLNPENAQMSFDGKLVGWTGLATGLSPEGIYHLVKDPNGNYALDGSSCFLSWSKFFKDYKGNLFMREQGPDIWFGTQSNYMIQACYADYSSGVLQWGYFEEFIQNDLVESFQLFKEATEWDV
jgi:Zn-finger nucleic acid-binding protein